MTEAEHEFLRRCLDQHREACAEYLLQLLRERTENRRDLTTPTTPDTMTGDETCEPKN